jgi:hypothetical protein
VSKRHGAKEANCDFALFLSEKHPRDTDQGMSDVDLFIDLDHQGQAVTKVGKGQLRVNGIDITVT